MHGYLVETNPNNDLTCWKQRDMFTALAILLPGFYYLPDIHKINIPLKTKHKPKFKMALKALYLSNFLLLYTN